MNLFIKSALLITATFSLTAFAEYTRLAECSGYTQKSVASRAVLFVDKNQDTNGMILVTIANVGDFLTPTKISWTANAQGFPRFFDNDFDLDIVISDQTASSDDVLIGEEYIDTLVCEYAPN